MTFTCHYDFSNNGFFVQIFKIFQINLRFSSVQFSLFHLNLVIQYVNQKYRNS